LGSGGHWSCGGRAVRRPQPRRRPTMNFRMHRWLDTLVSFAIIALGLTLAGATSILGA